MAVEQEMKDLDLQLWFREFIRADLPANQAVPDHDVLASKEMQANLFIDHFGALLKNEVSFRKNNTYDKLCSLFWSEWSFASNLQYSVTDFF